MIRTSFGKRAAIITFFCLLVFSGVALTVGGIWLIALGGSFYYAITGIGYIAAAVLVLKRSKSACYLTGLLFLMTVLWALWESGLNYWALFPRLLVPAASLLSPRFYFPRTCTAPRVKSRLTSPVRHYPWPLSLSLSAPSFPMAKLPLLAT